MSNHSSALKILVCYHKPYTLPPLDDGIMLPIQGGKSISDEDLHMQGDNEINGNPCDNISFKNKSYSEMTIVYWAWKNLKKLYPDIKYIGLCHYRRFFAFNDGRLFITDMEASSSSIKDYIADAKKVSKILESGRVIFAKRMIFPLSLCAQYSISHYRRDYDILREVIKEKFPDYYNAFVYVMEKNNKLIPYNMFIMKYDDFEKYCEWSFAVMDEIEKQIDYSNYPPYQKRVFGFIAERLMNIYTVKNKLKPKYLNVYFYDNDNNNKVEHIGFLQRMLRCLQRGINYLKQERIFMLSKAKKLNSHA